MTNKNIVIVGAGQIGSRHLQALKKVKFPLNITVIDPSQQSLTTAKQRYDEVPKGKYLHAVNYLQDMPVGRKIDLAIIATMSDIRAKIIKDILKKNRVSYLILEKILFDKKSDYRAIENIFSKLKTKAWVNLPRRMSPFYKKIKKELINQEIFFRGIGSQWGLACNAVHLLDLVSYFTGDNDYIIDTCGLDKKIPLSKRKGFLEISGTICADLKNGSHCELINHSSGNAPFVIEIFNKDKRYIIRESENKCWASNSKNNWQWKEVSFKPLLISETTTEAVENILKNGSCPLTPYKESVKIHLSLLEPLRCFINKNLEKKYEYYPFT